jgi:hypothetical protein
MTDEDGPTREQIIRFVEQVLKEHAPDADSQDVEESLQTLRRCDPDELEVNAGAAFAELCPGERACDAAFEQYAKLVGTGEVKHSPS